MPSNLEESAEELSSSLHHTLSSFSLSDFINQPSEKTSALDESIDSKDSLIESENDSFLLSIVSKWAINRNKENESESDFHSIDIPLSEDR